MKWFSKEYTNMDEKKDTPFIYLGYMFLGFFLLAIFI